MHFASGFSLWHLNLSGMQTVMADLLSSLQQDLNSPSQIWPSERLAARFKLFTGIFRMYRSDYHLI